MANLTGRDGNSSWKSGQSFGHHGDRCNHRLRRPGVDGPIKRGHYETVNPPIRRHNHASRLALALVLVGLLASCPIVCGTAQAAACHHGGGTHRHVDSERERSDLPVPANDDDCICNGAIKAAESARSPGLTATVPSPEWIPIPGTVRHLTLAGLVAGSGQPIRPGTLPTEFRQSILRC